MIDLQTTVLQARVIFVPRELTSPLVLSSGAITKLTEARAEVTVRTGGREATGRGAVYLSDLWAWPDPSLSHVQRDARLRALCEAIAADLPALAGGRAAHPLALGLRLHDAVCEEDAPPPPLARVMCASPFDAALHDAAGRALGLSAFHFYEEPVPLPEADRYFGGGGACAAIRRLLCPPVRVSPAWLIIGPGDDLARDAAPWVTRRGYGCFKLKLSGRDIEADVARTVEVLHAVRELGAERARLTVDTNEASPDAAAVLAYLESLRRASPETFAALEYLEQPTPRDLARCAYDWRPVTALKPVLLDEGLVGLEVLETAVGQGWSGLALKTCKGHSVALAAAAWAHGRGMLLAMQDLTNPGVALIHAALFAAHVPTINGVELNSPQFTPAANAEWLPRLQPLFAPTDGFHRLPAEAPTGLGSAL